MPTVSRHQFYREFDSNPRLPSRPSSELTDDDRKDLVSLDDDEWDDPDENVPTPNHLNSNSLTNYSLRVDPDIERLVPPPFQNPGGKTVDLTQKELQDAQRPITISDQIVSPEEAPPIGKWRRSISRILGALGI